MPDPITILAPGNHGNVASELAHAKSYTRKLAGSVNNYVPPGAQQKSAPVDVADYSTLRLTLDVTSMTNRHGFENASSLHVMLEHSDDGLSWSELYKFGPMNAPGKQRAVIGAFEGTVRASWFHVRHGAEEQGIDDEVTIMWSLTGEATPAA